MASTAYLNGRMSTSDLKDEKGITGLRHYAGRLNEEFLRAWQQYQKYRTIKEMMTDPLVSASLWTYELLIRQVDWDFEPADDSDLAQEHAEFAREVFFHDMSHSWNDTLSEHLSMIAWGWSLSEIVWKRRLGESRDPSTNSKYNDGKWGIRKLPIRAQETLDHWYIDDGGGVQGIQQRDFIHGKALDPLPIDKALLFRTTSHKGSPEGVSMLRGAYIPWYQKKQIATLQAISYERDSAGLHIARVPAEIMTDPDHAATYRMYQDIVVNLRKDEQAGIVLPSTRDEHGHYLYDLERIQSAGNNNYDAQPLVDARNKEIVFALLTDIILIGHEGIGSLALHSSRSNLLSYSLGGVADNIASIYQRHMLPRLWRMNGLPSQTIPWLTHGDIESVDLDELGNFIVRMGQGGFDLSDIENEVRRRAGLPMREADDEDDMPMPQPQRLPMVEEDQENIIEDEE